ncbi:MAG: sigma-54 interaction domain-containing protein [Saprospiraceae bacterium]
MANLQTIKQRFGIIGRSPLLDQVLDTAIRVANTDLTVLINGESGVGKEVFSKIIHSLSARKHNNFIAINCGAIPEGTINSELFGHEKGAFTGASSDRKGYFETVNTGTIFLDEIGEMPLDTQAYLLRVLEVGEYMRVGSSKVQKTDVRVVAATNVNLLDKIKKSKFREDLYYRLNTVPLKVPSLKERPEDINLLFRKFALDFAEKYRTTPVRLDEKAQLLISNYRWPGNIRELKNIAEQLSVMSEEKDITAENLIQLIPNILDRNLPALRDKNGTGENFEEREILYKLLFDMKNDLNDLKSLVFELIRNNDLNIPDMQALLPFKSNSTILEETKKEEKYHQDFNKTVSEQQLKETPESFEGNNRPIILNTQHGPSFDKMEVVEENLSLEEMEKDLIQKALKKHNGRRKDAALELGISERTLYRKIKFYDL